MKRPSRESVRDREPKLPWTRREFLGATLIGAGAIACGGHRLAGPPSEPTGTVAGGQAPVAGAVPAGAKPLRIVFYTDIHARTEWETPVAMAKAAQSINALEPDLVIVGGDLITDGFQSSAASVAPRWDTYLSSMHRAIRAPLYPVLGNHDLVGAIPEDGSRPSSDPRSDYLARMGLKRAWYAFEAGGYRFFVLDSVQVIGGDLKYEGRITEEQLTWLRDELRSLPADRPIVVACHMPLLTGFYQATEGAVEPAPSNRVVVNNREVLESFAGRRLVAVLQGHLHVNERLWWRGTTFITGGAVCGKWWRGEWHGTEEGFGLLTLDGDKVGWDYLDYGWEAKRPDGV